MKNLRKSLKAIRDFITILGIPAIGVLGWNMHSEQIKLKDEQLRLKDYIVATKQAEIEFLQKTRSNVILDVYEREKVFFENHFKILSDSIKDFESTIDSLERRFGIKKGDVTYLGYQGEADSIKSFYYEAGKIIKGYNLKMIDPVGTYAEQIESIKNQILAPREKKSVSQS